MSSPAPLRAAHLDRPPRKRGGLAGARSAVLPTVSGLLLVGVAAVPLVPGDALLINAGSCALAVVAAAAWGIDEARRRVRPFAVGTGRREPSGVVPPRRGPLWGTLEMVLVLAPVLLLTFVFPVAASRIVAVEVAGVPLTTLLLASSLTVPWMSMAVCLPLYRAIGHLLPVTDPAAVRVRFLSVWPATFLQTVPVVLLFAVPVELVLRWSPTALLTYVGLCILHAAFAQSLVLVNVNRDRLLWASAWLGYAAALWVLPAAWFLPPIVGLLTQLLPLRKNLHEMRSRMRLDHRDVALDLGRGLLLGSVLWAHLLFLFLNTQAAFDVTLTFFAVLPAVLAYNYYFVRLAPEFDQAVVILRSTMENDSQSALAQSSGVVSASVVRSISRTGFVGAVLTLAVVLITYDVARTSVGLVSAIALASWLFLMTTLLCYKLDYVGQTRQAQVFSAAHLVIVAAAFVLLPVGPLLYWALVGAELVVFGWLMREALTQWRTSEYALFWRHATAW